jgi:hypothetical protein
MRRSLMLGLLVVVACQGGNSGWVTGGSAAHGSAAVPATIVATPPPPPAAPAAPVAWKVGDIVQVQATDKWKYWYEAQIITVGPTFKVLYTYADNVEDGIDPARVRRVEWVAKTDVEAQVDGQWKPGKVVSHDPDGHYQISIGGGPPQSLDGTKIRGLRKPKSVAHASSSSSSSSANAPCPGPGLTRRCSGVCVNIQEDSNNCGSCGNRCRDGYRCDGHMSCRDASGNL